MSGVSTVKSDIRTFWSAHAHLPDMPQAHTLTGSRERAALRALLSRMLGTARGGDVLDLGAGTGEVTELIAELGARVTAIDLSEAMLARARARLALRDVRLSLGDAEHLAEPDGSYDAVVCHNLVWTLTEPDLGFAEWRRVLRPGGRLVIIDGDWVGFATFGETRQRLADAWERLTGRIVSPSSGDALARITAQLPFRGGLRPGQLVPLLAMAGFGAFEHHDMSAVRRARRRALWGASWLRAGMHERFALTAFRLNTPAP
jgi:ubiquinone/menaquinone biosynthesis C-methylase UbiE